MAWLSGWSYRKAITVQDAYVDSDLTDFPLYVKVAADGDMSTALATGYDVRFTQSDGETLLYYERETWSGGGGSTVTADFWVRVPSIAATGGASIYIYWGKADASDGEAAANTWDANSMAVWHMDDLTTSSIQDSTSYNNDGTKVAANEPIETTGKIGKGQYFDGIDDYVDCGSDLHLNPTEEITVEMWAQSVTETWSHRAMLSRRDVYIVYPEIDTKDINFVVRIDGTWRSTPWLTVDDITIWHHYVGTYDGQTLRMYLDGELEESAVHAGTIDSDPGKPLYIGRDSTRYGNILVDEARISNIARPAAWIKFEFHNVSSADNELEWGVQASAAGGPRAYVLG